MGALLWIVLSDGAAIGRICGLPLLAARMAAESVYPEFDDLQLIGRLSATPQQLRDSIDAPLVTPETLAAAGIVPCRGERHLIRQIQRREIWAKQEIDRWAARAALDPRLVGSGCHSPKRQKARAASAP